MTPQLLDPVRPAGARSMEIEPVAGRIGAQVCRVRLSGALGEEAVRRLRAALLRHKVLFFRDQHHLDAAEQTAFARLLGEPVPAPPAPGGAWHTDLSYRDRPSGFSVLRAVEVPSHGGDTVWANTAAAYDDLPVELREVADRLWLRHADGAAQAEHPLVRVHPETGERALLLGGYARAVAGLSDEADSEALIRLFQERVTRLENTVRWRWSPGDVAVWDNRATQHRVVHDYGGEPRRLRHVAVAGEAPIAVDGRRGVPLG
ncbi:TauD/TfdA dioxygenase family protein [Actinomadura macrotermitis]|uniref:Alpha-ketoglutarate-dependent sulfate ester dioxygenase n=1 Tax=Actinomadura macrotermitis TaxID=2585200 RepID=A0A7K0BNG0_9ACTN|nr:TauD/TfdA family dioxygenase [Actinomadura macrotermitis]MQY02715.1 Alpha-ketoglutarate-dependent sulfate ester dioxygenase [Actinomadura macrotermitis]